MKIQSLFIRRRVPGEHPWDKLDLIIRREVVLYTHVRWPRQPLFRPGQLPHNWRAVFLVCTLPTPKNHCFDHEKDSLPSRHTCGNRSAIPIQVRGFETHAATESTVTDDAACPHYGKREFYDWHTPFPIYRGPLRIGDSVTLNGTENS